VKRALAVSAVLLPLVLFGYLVATPGAGSSLTPWIKRDHNRLNGERGVNCPSSAI